MPNFFLNYLLKPTESNEMFSIPRVNFNSSSRFQPNPNGSTVTLNQAGASEKRNVFRRIKSFVSSYRSAPLHPPHTPNEGLELSIPRRYHPRRKTYIHVIKSNEFCRRKKVLEPIDIEPIRKFEPTTCAEAMEAVRLARHALLNENVDETKYFLPNEVFNMLEKAQRVLPENPDINFWLGLCARRQVHPSCAKEKEMAQRSQDYLEKVLRVYPKHRDVKVHYAASLWVTARAYSDTKAFPLLMARYKAFLQEDESDLFLHILAAQRALSFRLITSEGLQSIEKIAADNLTDIPIQSFLLSAYYDCFIMGFTAIRVEIARTNTFDGIYKKTISCIEHLKLLDPKSKIVWQTERRLQINGKDLIPIWLSGPDYMPRADGILYDALWRQDTSLNLCTPFEQKRLQKYPRNKYSASKEALDVIKE